MGKSTDRNVAAEAEFAKLEQMLNQTAEDTSNCLKMLKKHLSEYDSRNGNHFTHTARSYMRSDMRTAKDTAMDLKHVAHEINRSHTPSQSEITSARNTEDRTTKALEILRMTARNYDRENRQSMGVKGRVDAAVGGDHHKEKHDNHGLLGDKHDHRDEKHGLLGNKDDKYHHEHRGENHGLLGENKNENHGGMLGNDNNHSGGLLGKTDKEKHGHHGGLFGNDDKNGGGVIGSSETVETLVTKVLHDHFSVSALDHQITTAEKSLKPSIIERAKEKIHDVKEKIKGDKSGATHDGVHHHEGHHVNP